MKNYSPIPKCGIRAIAMGLTPNPTELYTGSEEDSKSKESTTEPSPNYILGIGWIRKPDSEAA